MDKKCAYDLLESTLERFAREKNSLLEFYPRKAEDRDTCFLWSYFATTGMLYQAVRAGFPVKHIFKEYIDALPYYRCAPQPGKPVKYHSERGSRINGGHGPCFFDDNIWTARNYLFAYEVFEEQFYLEEARRVVEFVYSGWDECLGGVVWNENGLTEGGTVQELERGLSANACASLISAVLHRITGEERYLSWSKRFYEFCKTVQDPETKIYYNGIHTRIENGGRTSGEVNKDLYSYNSGSMILVNLELYQITGDPQYLEDAQATSEAAFHAFLAKDESSGQHYFKDFIWFTAILAEGWSALISTGAQRERGYMKMLSMSVEYASRFRNSAGLLPHDLVCGWRSDDDYDRMLLTHSAIAEIAVLCSE